MTAVVQITLFEKTQALLRERGCEGESDDQILKRLIDERALASMESYSGGG